MRDARPSQTTISIEARRGGDLICVSDVGFPSFLTASRARTQVEKLDPALRPPFKTVLEFFTRQRKARILTVNIYGSN
jgi:hypothetical protein